MRLTMRTILVLIFGAALSLVLYIAADSTFGEMIGPNGFNPNFSALISTWRALGGSAHSLDGDGQGFGRGPFGGGSFGGGLGEGLGGGRGRHRSGVLTDGLDLTAAPGQTASDLLWIGIPALLGAAIEIDAMYIRRRRKQAKKRASRRPAGRSAAHRRRRARQRPETDSSGASRQES